MSTDERQSNAEGPVLYDAASSILSVPVTLDTTGGGGLGYDYSVGTRIPAWLSIDGEEISNPARVLDYLRSGVAGPGIQNVAPSPCAFLYRISGAPTSFISPVSDPAPWYDDSRPESGQFLGIIINQLALASVTRRNPTDLPGSFGGSILGARQSIGRRIDVQATLLASSVSGADYGLEWLSGLLGDAGCASCGSSTVEFRQSCPPVDGSDDDMGYWQAYRTGLTTGPDMASQDALGNMTDVTWSWVSEMPYLYKSITPCLPESPLDVAGVGTCIPFDEWLCGAGGQPQCCTIAPPLKGTWAGIVTVSSDVGVGAITLSTFQACPPDLNVDTPTSMMQIRALQGTLIIDSAQHAITYVSPADPVTGEITIRDGTDFIFIPEGEGLQWIEVDDCDPATCICAYSTYPCGQGSQGTVQIDVQYRRR